MPDPQTYNIHMENDVSPPSGINSHWQDVNSIPKPSLHGDSCKNVFDFHIFYFFLVFIFQS